jgi:hypothetical protein
MSELTLSGSLGHTDRARQTEVASPSQLTLRRFMRHRLAVVAIGVLALVILSAILTPLSPYSPTEQI